MVLDRNDLFQVFFFGNSCVKVRVTGPFDPGSYEGPGLVELVWEFGAVERHHHLSWKKMELMLLCSKCWGSGSGEGLFV